MLRPPHGVRLRMQPCRDVSTLERTLKAAMGVSDADCARWPTLGIVERELLRRRERQVLDAFVAELTTTNESEEL